MKVRVITDVTVCFDAEIPDEEIGDYQADRNSDLFQTAWNAWHKLEEICLCLLNCVLKIAKSSAL